MGPSLIRFLGVGSAIAGPTYTLSVTTANFTTTLTGLSLSYNRKIPISSSEYTTSFYAVGLNYSQVFSLTVNTNVFNTTFSNTIVTTFREVTTTTTAYSTSFNDTILQYNGGYVIEDNYSRSSVNVAGSSITGTGDSAVISLKPRLQESEVVSSTSRWLEPSARITGVNGYRPTFRFLDYGVGVDKYHGYPWQTTRRPMFSYDRETWYYFDTQTVAGSYIEFRHNTSFTSDTIYVSRNRQTTVDQVGAWLEGLETTYPSMFGPSDAAASFSPTLTSWSGQDFIADEFSSQTDELARTIPATPFYAAEINDTSLMPPGDSKYLALIIAGVHAGEDHGHFAMRSFVEYLLGNSTEAQELRRYYRVLIYPMLNAPGNEGGGWRGSFTQGDGGVDDANRHFYQTGTLLEIIDKPKAVMLSDLNSGIPDWMIDWHGAYNNDWGFHSDGLPLHNDLMSKLAANSGFTVNDTGNTLTGFTSRYFQNQIGADLAVTMEHGATTPISNADLDTWGQAVVESLHQMRVEGDFTAPGDPDYSIPVTTTAYSTTFNDVSFGGAYTLAVSNASTTTVFSNINLITSRALGASVGPYSTTFNDLTLLESQVFPIDSIGYTTTFNSVQLLRTLALPITTGSYSTAFNNIGVFYSTIASINTQTYTTSFNNISIEISRVLPISTEEYVTTLNNIALSYEGNVTLLVDTSQYTTTTQNIGLTVSRHTPVSTSSYITSFNTVNTTKGYILPITTAGFTTTFQSINPISYRTLNIANSTFITTYNTIAFTYPYTAYTYRERIQFDAYIDKRVQFDVYITREYEIGSTIAASLKKGLEL